MLPSCIMPAVSSWWSPSVDLLRVFLWSTPLRVYRGPRKAQIKLPSWTFRSKTGAATDQGARCACMAGFSRAYQVASLTPKPMWQRAPTLRPREQPIVGFITLRNKLYATRDLRIEIRTAYNNFKPTKHTVQRPAAKARQVVQPHRRRRRDLSLIHI